MDNYSLDWNPLFGRIPPPLPSSSVPRPSATPTPGSAQVRGRNPGRGPRHASQCARPRPSCQAQPRARRPARTYAAATRGAGLGTPHSALENGRGGGRNRRGGGPPFSQGRIELEHTIWGDPGVSADRVVR